MDEVFHKIALSMSRGLGSTWAFLVALAIILGWLLTGPLFHYSDTWQLVINTGTSVVTFLMVFLIQNTQNRDSKAMQLKLDELIKGVEGARTGLVNLESMSDKELRTLELEFQRLSRQRQPDK
jgi:low affinity Fe/Cu permease